MFSKIITCFIFCVMVWLGGLVWFVSQIPTKPTTDDTPADVIVVLTGGGGRLEYGLQLLAQGKGQKLFITGVSKGVSTGALLAKAPATTREALAALPEGSVVLGHKAVNTIGNAEETAAWLKAHNYKSIRLVTSSYHMPRSLSEFREAMPGIAILPSPSFSDDFSPDEWWRDRDDRTLVLSEFHKYVAGQLRHWLISARH